MKKSDWYYSLMFNEAIYTKSKQAYGFNENTKKIVNDNIVMVLTDENINSKLLGIEVDLGRESDMEKNTQ